MKKYRRIEITAFRRRVLIASGKPPVEIGEIDVKVKDADAPETMQSGSDEEQEILIEAVRLLEERISQRMRPDVEPSDSPTYFDAVKR